ncbi:isovaleryl-CoA dehydrogenase [Pendulispora brunnea]|uniref:Isovaleryl-CoA dehydrogenase n=1 Tax=Pendulispora brunnea TaxID=2905690 RepID=A0ABZ2K1E4_9BACT
MTRKMDPGQERFQTHEVANVPPALVDYNLFTTDRVLAEATEREGAGWATADLTAFGEKLGRAETIELGFLANRNLPILHTHDRTGRRRDEVEYHPSWHELMSISVGQGLHGSPWSDPKDGAHVARAAGLFLLVQVEAGVMCPTTTTYASVPALRRQPELAAEWEPMILPRRYDPRFRPAKEKSGVLVSMGMTEKQGGTDLRTNASRAVPIGRGGPGGEYRIVGHKWFFSIPMCDAFLVTAQAPGGLSCFLMPRWTPDGAVNGLRLQRLKDKLGNRANASSEVEFQDAWARLVGEEGRGVVTIMEMVNYTRLDCAVGSAAQIRQAVAQAIHYASHRQVFQRALVEQPLMAQVLADLAIESEVATALVLRLARAFDLQNDEHETALRRLITPAIKYWTTKRCPAIVTEALESFGGVGYIEECIMPRLYREAPLNSIWEGSGNVMCLDVRRALARSPESATALLKELRLARGSDPRLDHAIAALEPKLRDPDMAEAQGRTLVEHIVLALAGSLLVRFSPPAVADAFCASRLAGHWTGAFGTLPAGADTRAIVQRATPAT